jgi:hypothetical protein
VSLSIGYGLGIFSVVFFLMRLLGATQLMVADLVVFALLIVSFLLRRTHATTPKALAPVIGKPAGPVWFHRVLNAAFVIAMASATYAAILRTLAHPHGDGWDPFSVWNLHARFLFLGGSHWRDGFTSLLPGSHPDYPLLLSAAIAHFWTFLGHDSPAVPAIIGPVFTCITVGLLFSALSILRGSLQAMLATIVLVATPAFIEQGTSQYADVPLSFFYLATIVLLCLHDHDAVDDRSRRYWGSLALAGLAAAFAAWTKNEGQLFLCAVVASRLFVLISPRRRRQARREHLSPDPKDWIGLAALLILVAPAILFIAWFKHSMPSGDLLSDPGSWLRKLSDPARYWVVIQWYMKAFFRFGHWVIIPGTLTLIAFWVVARKQNQSGLQPGIRTSILALVLTLAGYFAIYVITPNDIYWQLRFSLTRVLLQLWPSTIFLVFLSTPMGTVPVRNS